MMGMDIGAEGMQAKLFRGSSGRRGASDLPRRWYQTMALFSCLGSRLSSNAALNSTEVMNKYVMLICIQKTEKLRSGMEVPFIETTAAFRHTGSPSPLLMLMLTFESVSLVTDYLTNPPTFLHTT